MLKNISKLSIEDESLYSKFILAAFFMFIIPILLALYLVFVVMLNKDKPVSLEYSRLLIFWMVASGLFGYLIIRRTVKSILEVITRARGIAEGKFEGKLEVRNQDELKDLASAFNRITSELEKKVNELEQSRSITRELFQKISHAITSTKKLDALFGVIVQSTRKVLKADTSFIAIYNPEDSKLYLKAYSGPQKDLSENMPIEDKGGVIGLVMNTKEPMVIKKPKADNPNAPKSQSDEKIRYSNILCVPIAINGKPRGVMAVADLHETEKIDTEDLYLLENIAHQVGASIENFDLNKSIEETYFQTLLTLARAVEAKDAYSAGHLERVSEYVDRMAEKLRLDDESKKTLHGGAILHDLGKLGIRDEILKKPGKFTEEEYEIMKEHTIIGENILKPIRTMAKLSELVKCHHEHYDGTGYPLGLKGEEIPLLARILTIADIYDALTTERPYKKAMSVDDAIRTLRSYSGTQLDPKLVEVFIVVLDDIHKEKMK